MADVKDEKIFTIPLREVFEKSRRRRAKLAVNVVRSFLKKHMKSEEVKIGVSINKSIWARGIQKPPRKVKVHALKTAAGVYAELVGADIKPPTEAEMEKKAGKLTEKEKKVKEARKERKKMTLEQEVQKDKAEAEKPREEIKAEKVEETKEPQEKKEEVKTTEKKEEKK